MMVRKNNKKNYGFAFVLTWPVIMALAIGIPLFIFGIGSVIKFFSFMNQPVVNGSIPVWVIFVGGMILLLLMRNKRRGY